MQNLETATIGKYILKSYEIGGNFCAGLWLDTPKGKWAKEKCLNAFKFKTEERRAEWLQTKYNNIASNLETDAKNKAERKAKAKEAGKADTRETSALVKKYLQTKYGVKFTIRSESYTGGSSLNISWDLGPSSETIEKETGRLKYGTFDGMIDLAGIKNAANYGMKIDGKDLKTYKHVFARRESFTPEFSLQIAKSIWNCCKLSHWVEPTAENLHNYMPGDNQMRDWSQVVHRAAYKAHFVTDQADKIKNLRAEHGNGIFYESFVFTYEFEGKTYTTENPTIQTPKVEKEKTIKTNGVRMVDYSENAVAVIGKTFEIKDELKEHGGRFNRALKIDGELVAGWVFSKTKESQIADLLIEYAND